MIINLILNVIVRSKLVLLEEFEMEGLGLENTMRKIFKGIEKLWNHFLKPGLKIGTAIISAGVAAKTENLQSAQVTSKF